MNQSSRPLSKTCVRALFCWNLCTPHSRRLSQKGEVSKVLVGWGSDEKVDDSKLHEGDGIIMLTSDPAGLYNSVSDHSEPVKDGLVEYSIVKRSSQMYLMTNLSKTKSPKVSNRLTFRQK